MVKNANVLKSSFSVSINHGYVTISTYRDARTATEKDYKVDALLIAQKVTEAFDTVQLVRCVFCNPANPSSYKFVDVQKATVDSFSSGQLDDQQMLSILTVLSSAPQTLAHPRNSIKVANAAISNYLATQAIEGFQRKPRRKLLDRIRMIGELEESNEELWNKFLTMEQCLRTGKLDQMVALFEELNKTVTVVLGKKADSIMDSLRSKLDKLNNTAIKCEAEWQEYNQILECFRTGRLQGLAARCVRLDRTVTDKLKEARIGTTKHNEAGPNGILNAAVLL